MDYERIHKPQTGMISPIAATSLEVSSVQESRSVVSETSPDDPISCQPKETLRRENVSAGHVKMQQYSKGDTASSSAVHPMRILEDESVDYDSNASSSSFEFDKGEKSSHNQLSRSFSRPVPSKWNDAEKWIINRHIVQPNYPKRNAPYNQTNRLPISNMVRVAPEVAHCDHKSSNNRGAETKRVDFCQPTTQMALEKFSFVPPGSHPISGQASGVSACGDLRPLSKDLKEVGHMELSCTRSSAEDATVVPPIRAVCMRDMGTEMTPVPSQEPSRTATPVGATTPLRSPMSSIPSTPRRGAPAPTPTTDEETPHPIEPSKTELSEQELKMKTRREIVALGVQLGKMNIANWASKNELEKNASSVGAADREELERVEFEKRAAAWEEAEKSRHVARFKREEIKIQAWESQQNAKLEAEMRRIEAKVEQMRAQAKAKMVKKIAMARQRSEEKRAAAEARKNQEAERSAAQAEYIRQTGRMPSSTPYMCCGWLS
ncbi:hypothetical protein HS088_TW01G00631 [Tripterygium wilfordii]|uniref:Remorin C-terminal domain-containing protein n=1 Tax=Tripterygium wilfordii TaxID=458696 RepID=A0A7J7E296_TRIWF|nr:hypothetical protein HS088_TW01G00631 [Tripterygium wilfordii]